MSSVEAEHLPAEALEAGLPGFGLEIPDPMALVVAFGLGRRAFRTTLDVGPE